MNIHYLAGDWKVGCKCWQVFCQCLTNTPTQPNFNGVRQCVSLVVKSMPYDVIKLLLVYHANLFGCCNDVLKYN